VSPPPPAGHAWDGGTRGWDVYYGVILLGVLGLVIATAAQENQPAGARAITCAALAAMAPWYLLHRRTVLYGESSLARGLIYLAGLWILFIIASSQGIIEIWVLLALGPQCFLAVPFRWAVGAIIALNVAPVAVALITGASPGELTALIVAGVLTVAFSVAFGSWVLRIIAQSYDRASLIEQLSQTRAELASANRRAGVLAERQRLSAEIHDTLAQGFTSMIMLLQAARADVERQPAAARGASRAGPGDGPGQPGRGPGPGGRARPGRPGARRARRRAAQAGRDDGRAPRHGRPVRRGRPGRPAAPAG